MNSLDNTKKAKEIIKLISDARQIDDWRKIFTNISEDITMKKFIKNREKYPPISFSFTHEEIKGLPDRINPLKMETTIEKLLCAAIWKNGDLLKIDHIIKGLKGDKEDQVQASETEETAMTFHHFGKYLAKPHKNPIIDQHVIRAYRALETKGDFNGEALLIICNSGLLNGRKDKEICKNYIEWVNQQSNPIHDDNQNIQLFQVIDDVMFAFGRYLKS